MTKLRKEVLRLLCVEGQPMKLVSAQKSMAVFFIHSISDTIQSCLLGYTILYMIRDDGGSTHL
jgi:hypothetical protein